MAVFGKGAVGASQNTQTADFIECYRYQMPDAGQPTKISASLRGLASGPQVMRCALYDDDPQTTKPRNLLAISAEVSIAANQPQGFVDFTLTNAPIIQPGFYHLGIWVGAASNQSQLDYDSVAGSGFFVGNTYSSTANSINPWVGGASHSHKASIFCTYNTVYVLAPGGGAGSGGAAPALWVQSGSYGIFGKGPH